MGIVGTAAGGAVVIMWWISGAVGAEFGWRASFRYPPLIIAVLGIAFYFIARDRPSDVNLPEYVEEDEVSATPEAIDPQRLKGFGPYTELLSNPRFLLASHVKGLENVVRYGLTTWVPIYYFEEGKLSIESTVLLTILLPVGYLIAPPVAGIISDRYLGSRRRPMVLFSCAVTTVVPVGIAFSPAVPGRSCSWLWPPPEWSPGSLSPPSRSRSRPKLNAACLLHCLPISRYKKFPGITGAARPCSTAQPRLTTHFLMLELVIANVCNNLFSHLAFDIGFLDYFGRVHRNRSR